MPLQSESARPLLQHTEAVGEPRWTPAMAVKRRNLCRLCRRCRMMWVTSSMIGDARRTRACGSWFCPMPEQRAMCGTPAAVDVAVPEEQFGLSAAKPRGWRSGTLLRRGITWRGWPNAIATRQLLLLWPLRCRAWLWSPRRLLGGSEPAGGSRPLGTRPSGGGGGQSWWWAHCQSWSPI